MSRDLFRAIVIGGTALVGACAQAGAVATAATTHPATSGAQRAPSTRPASPPPSGVGRTAGAFQPGMSPRDEMVLIL